MKKFFVVPLVLIMLCGCARQKNVAPVTDNISFSVQISHTDKQYVCDADVSNGALKLIIKEPQEIKDLILNVNNDSFTTEFMGVSYTSDINTLPQGALVQIIFDVLSDVKDKSARVVDKKCIINGGVSGYKYSLILSPSGLPISIKIDELNLNIQFNNVTIK